MKSNLLYSLAAFVASAVLGLPASLHAGVDMFLRLPNMAGEATATGHSGEIEILAFSWGLANSGTTHAGGGAGSGKSVWQDLQLTKYVDASSPGLVKTCAQGQHISSALLTLRYTGSTLPEFFRITLTNVLVTSLSTGGSGGEDRLTETVTLNFAEVWTTYTPTLPAGPGPGHGIDFSFDILMQAQAGGIPPVVAPVEIGDFSATVKYVNGAPTATLSWSSIAGLTYRLLCTEDVTQPFKPYGDYPSARDGTTSITVPANMARSFFRVELAP